MTTQPELEFTPRESANCQLPTAPCQLPPEVLTIIGYLSQHCRGPANVASARKIAAFMGLTGADPARQVRHLIELYLDQFPFIVVGNPGHGYYITDDPEEMRHYEATLYSLVQSAARKIAAFRRLAASHGYTRTGAAPQAKYHRRTYGASPCRP